MAQYEIKVKCKEIKHCSVCRFCGVKIHPNSSYKRRKQLYCIINNNLVEASRDGWQKPEWCPLVKSKEENRCGEN